MTEYEHFIKFYHHYDYSIDHLSGTDLDTQASWLLKLVSKERTS